ncbi:MAG: endonuclease III [Rhodospirillales bacterium]
MFESMLHVSVMVQLLFAFDERPRVLREVHHRLEQHFGPQGPFLLLDPVSQLVMALIGVRTPSAVTKAAFEALWLDFGAWESVRDAPVAAIRRTIAAVTYPEVKAPQLKATLGIITDTRGCLDLDNLEEATVPEALAWLEQLPGVGRKVAAATLNFSSLRKAVLVIDTHHLRVLRRLGLVPSLASLNRAHEGVTVFLPFDWTADDLDEHHQLMKQLGQTCCRHREPLCGGCPVANLCATAKGLTQHGRHAPSPSGESGHRRGPDLSRDL